MMDRNELLRALRRLKVETGSLACFGCGLEHDCSTRGCAILRVAISALELDATQLSASETARTDLAQALARNEQERYQLKAALEEAVEALAVHGDCEDCAHGQENRPCEQWDFTCANCTEMDCPCRDCVQKSKTTKWTWKGAADV